MIPFFKYPVKITAILIANRCNDVTDRKICLAHQFHSFVQTFALKQFFEIKSRIFPDHLTQHMHRQMQFFAEFCKCRRFVLLFDIIQRCHCDHVFILIRQALNTTPEQIALAIRASLPTVSLTPSDGEDGLREWDVPVDSPEEALSEQISLREVLNKLPPADFDLIRMRYFAGRTQSETARQLGTTQVQVSRRERKILTWMRLQLLGEAVPCLQSVKQPQRK